MGFFNWLFGKHEQPQPASPRRAKVIRGLDDGSPFVVVENENGAVMMMDRMAYEYMYGESKKPDPSQQALDGLLAQVARVKVWAGGMMRDNPTSDVLLAEETEPAVLESFRLQDRVAAEVVQAHAQIESARERVKDAEAGLKDALDSVEKNFEGLTQTKRAGNLVLLVVRPAEAVASVQALAAAYADYYVALADFNRGQFRLYRALGHPARFVLGPETTSGDCPAVPEPVAPRMPPAQPEPKR